MLSRRRPRLAAAMLAVLAAAALAPTASPPVAAAPAPAANDMTPWVLPTRPPRCTSKQIAAGTVADCLLGGFAAPDENGWPAPPFPAGDPSGAGVVPYPGWTFGGYGYNGSPALATFEAQMVANQVAIGPVRAGLLKTMPDALPLFQGFLRDIIAGGYRVTDAATYSFRCTSNSASRNCAGLTRGSLSLHSWGLAMDMNSGANPERTYTGVDGASACATPMVTDLPQWVVRTAEKWGLYWGGYGYSSGCSSPTDVKASALRDATHFEFHGSPAVARAIAALNYGGTCLSTVDDSGIATPRCLLPGETPGKGWRVVVDTKAPAGATAALVNLTMTGAAAAGYVTAEGCGAAAAGERTSSNGNVAPGQTVANLAVVALDASGRFCLYRSQPVHTIVDVQGFFAPARTAGATATLFNPVAAQRVMDTRISSFCAPGGECTERGPVRENSETSVATPILPATAVAALANLTVTEPRGAGYLTADTCSALVPGPQTHSNANFGAADTVANLAVVPVEPSATGAQFCTYTTSAAQSVVDVQGYFAPASAGGWGLTAMTPQRLVDTRSCWTDPVDGTQRCGQAVGVDGIVRMKAPAGAAAVLVNLTLTDAQADGYAVAVPCSAVQTTGSSNGNVVPGRVAANLAVVAVDPDGTFCVRVSAPMHVVVDLQGTFASGGALSFLPTSPVRRSDTRQG